MRRLPQALTLQTNIRKLSCSPRTDDSFLTVDLRKMKNLWYLSDRLRARVGFCSRMLRWQRKSQLYQIGSQRLLPDRVEKHLVVNIPI